MNPELLPPAAPTDSPASPLEASGPVNPDPLPAATPDRGIWPKAVPLLVLAGLLAYCNSFTKAFVLDDIGWITGNPDIENFAAYVSGNRSVVRLSIQLNYKLGGLNPIGYHAFNFVVHLLAGLALFGLVRRVLLLPLYAGRYDSSAPRLAFAVALLWLVHPLQTQSVTYIIQRCESMMGLFYLFAMYAWLRGATGGGRAWYPVAVGSFALCCGCKEVAATLPPVLVVFDRVFLARSWRELLRARWLAYLGVLAVWLVALAPMLRLATGIGIGGESGGGGAGVGIGFELKSATPWTYLLTQSEVILHYLRLSVWPTNQAIDYLDWPIARSLRDVWPAFAAVSAGLLASLALLYYRPPVGFVAFAFFAFLAPTSSVMPIVDPAFEHRMYLSLASVAVGVVFAAHALLGAVTSAHARDSFGGAALVGAAAVLIVLTHVRNETYRSHVAALENNTAVRPNNPRPWTSLAAMYINAGDLERAEAAISRAEELPNAQALAMRQRAALYALTGQLDKSEAALTAIIRGTQFHYYMSPVMYKNLVWVRLARDNPAGASETARELARLQPQVAENQMTLAATELAVGRDAEARAAAAEAVRLNPGEARRAASEARAFVFAADSPATPFRKARALWQAAAAALADGDRDPMILDTLAMAYAWHGRLADATAAARRGIAAADAAGDADWAAALRTRLKLYEAGQVYK